MLQVVRVAQAGHKPVTEIRLGSDRRAATDCYLDVDLTNTAPSKTADHLLAL
jgi:hypothetical protein